MGDIRRLPGDLANQIAAGEVVERPSSIVKELVENALDAQATRIEVAIERGGVDLVRVEDDGHGMDREDAALALERHATSKIRSSDDLFSLRTFGFRGEALPSIASVARLRLLTRARGADEGVEVRVVGGAAEDARPVGSREGTSIEVRDLFFNVPARRKFLKSTGTEAAHVSEALLVAALARPDVSLFLSRDGRASREWLRVGTRRERSVQAFDGERLEGCIVERGALRIEAHLSAPERARAGAVGLHLLVNGRPIRDRALARAVAQAYGSVLEPGRYPVGVVYVDLPPAEVDVNVHPQKAEVRFVDARGLHDAVTRELHASLAQAFSLPALGRPRAWNFSSRDRSEDQGLAHAGAHAPDSGALFLRFDHPDGTKLRADSDDLLRPEPAAGPSALAEDVAWKAAPSLGLEHDAPGARPGFYAALEFITQLRATFLLCAASDGLYVLDQHAAAERVTFHRLRRAFASRSVASQRLLVPEVVELSPAEVAVLEERAADVAALGIELRAVGASAVAVHAVPTLVGRAPPDRLVRDVVAEVGRLARRPFADASDRVIATMACHGSVRAGDLVTREEALALLRALDAVDFSGHCPHGRPVLTRIGYDELERRVGR